MELENQLESFGLLPKEIAIYLNLLQLGSSSIKEISAKSGIKRTTVYSILDSLIQKGLVIFSKKNNHREYFAENPSKIPHILEEKIRQIELKQKNILDALPELASIYNVKTTKPKIRYYEGIEGIKQLFEETLELNSGEETLAYSSAESIHKYLKEYVLDYLKRRIAKGITQRAIAEDSPEAREHQKNDQKELRQTILVSQKNFPFSNEINIFRNKVSIASYRDLLGVIIESAEIAKTQRAIFELAWIGAQQVGKFELSFGGKPSEIK